MPGTLSALYASRSEAEEALQRLRAEVDLGNFEIVDEGPARGYLLSAEVASHTSPDEIARILDDFAAELERRREGAQGRVEEAPQAPPAAGWATTEDVPARTPPQPPAPEEELRTGRRETARGAASVRFIDRVEQGSGEVRFADLEKRRVVEEAELAEAGILQGRTVELAETGEEPVITKVLFVREEVVIRKSTDLHSEEVVETLRRTEVDVERFDEPAGNRAAIGAHGDRERLSRPGD